MFILVLTVQACMDMEQNIQSKWSNVINEEMNLDVVTKAFKYAKNKSRSVYQYYIQYKSLHRWTVHNKL